jgi:hypothetical protein
VEAELRSAQNESLQQQEQHNNAMSSLKREDRDQYQATIQKLEEQVIKLTRNVEVYKSQVGLHASVKISPLYIFKL